MMNKMIAALLLLVAFALPDTAFGLGGSVTYPDGTPAAGATVTLSGGEEAISATCDSAGHFVLDAQASESTSINVSAPDKTDYAGVSLPSALFEGNGIAIVLQPK